MNPRPVTWRTDLDLASDLIKHGRHLIVAHSFDSRLS